MGHLSAGLVNERFNHVFRPAVFAGPESPSGAR